MSPLARKPCLHSSRCRYTDVPGVRLEPRSSSVLAPLEVVSPFTSLPHPEPSRMCSNLPWACFITGSGCFDSFALEFYGWVGSVVLPLRF
jgi:hypothetical protein